jgi:hypothetical protein
VPADVTRARRRPCPGWVVIYPVPVAPFAPTARYRELDDGSMRAGPAVFTCREGRRPRGSPHRRVPVTASWIEATSTLILHERFHAPARYTFLSTESHETASRSEREVASRLRGGEPSSENYSLSLASRMDKKMSNFQITEFGVGRLSSSAVQASSDNGRAVQASSDNGRAVQASSDNGRAVQASSDNGRAVQASSDNGRA